MKQKKYPKRVTELTHDLLKQLLMYDPDSGLFHWRRSRPGISKSRLAGTKSVHGYWQIFICGKIYRANRLAWFYVHGTWPEEIIDHIDENKLNDRLSNLRDVTSSENSRFYHSRRTVRQLKWTEMPQYHF